MVSTPVAYAGWLPPARVSRRVLAGAAAASIAVAVAVELALGTAFHARSAQMLEAAGRMLAAQAIVRSEKERRALMQPPDVDPNRTGLIGPEWSEITTTPGILSAKRTATNPDLAAALVRLVGRLDLPGGSSILIVLSGSLVGANVAAVAAVEALGLTPILVSSLGASMYGATDPEFSWLDIEAALRAGGVIAARSTAAVVGGERGVGAAMDAAGRDALAASAARHGVPLVETQPLGALVDELLADVRAATQGNPRLVINVGGSLIGLGTCEGIEALPAGLNTSPFSCREGTPGLVGVLAAAGIPVLHLLNMRSLVRQLGLPYDPVPLPDPGRNRKVYRVAGII